MLRRKSKTQFVNQERNTQNAIALLNYLKRITPQQLMLRKQVFTNKFFSAKNATATLLLIIKVFSQVISEIHTIITQVVQFPSAGLNHYAIRAVIN
jgi:hypothetical protein